MAMFRDMRLKRQVLTLQESEEILRKGSYGVLAVLGDEGYPYSVPLSYIYTDGRLYFHGADAGHKLEAVRGYEKVSFCVVDKDQIVPEEFTTYFRSVIVFGNMKVLETVEEKAAGLQKLADKYSADFHEGSKAEIQKKVNHVCVMELTPEHISGKQAIELVTKEG